MNLHRPILGLRPAVWLVALVLLLVAAWVWCPLIAPQSGEQGTEQVERRVLA